MREYHNILIIIIVMIIIAITFAIIINFIRPEEHFEDSAFSAFVPQNRNTSCTPQKYFMTQKYMGDISSHLFDSADVNSSSYDKSFCPWQSGINENLGNNVSSDVENIITKVELPFEPISENNLEFSNAPIDPTGSNRIDGFDVLYIDNNMCKNFGRCYYYELDKICKSESENEKCKYKYAYPDPYSTNPSDLIWVVDKEHPKAPGSSLDNINFDYLLNSYYYEDNINGQKIRNYVYPKEAQGENIVWKIEENNIKSKFVDKKSQTNFANSETEIISSEK